MSSRFHNLSALILLMLICLPLKASPTLRVCADPDNLPFSNRAGAGFDNRVITMIAHDLHRDLDFVWARARRGFLREEFNRNACDVLTGVPLGMHGVAVTAPYYTSSYAFVTRSEAKRKITGFNDAALNGKRIGLQILEEDLSPPSLPLIRAGYAGQIVGFDSFGDQEGEVVKAVAEGRIDAAVVWGPVAGYFAHRSRVPLTVTMVPSSYTFSGVPFTYGIGFAVHKQDQALLAQLNSFIQRLQPKIDRELKRFAVPVVARAEEAK